MTCKDCINLLICKRVKDNESCSSFKYIHLYEKNKKCGEWEEVRPDYPTSDIFDYRFRCSNCHKDTPQKAFVVAPDFCPNCGTDMRSYSE